MPVEGPDYYGENWQEGAWEKIEVTVDSGAIDTVAPKHVAGLFELEETKSSKAGEHYVAANGSKITNYGQRKVKGVTPKEDGEWQKIDLCMQVADVKKPLCSVSKLADTGYECVQGKRGCFLLDITTIGRIPLYGEKADGGRRRGGAAAAASCGSVFPPVGSCRNVPIANGEAMSSDSSTKTTRQPTNERSNQYA